jgi:hypothetical protein
MSFRSFCNKKQLSKIHSTSLSQIIPLYINIPNVFLIHEIVTLPNIFQIQSKPKKFKFS